jgi:hypothetical protein
MIAPNGFDWALLANGFSPKSKVVFAGACGVDANFISQWHLQQGQALIVPVFSAGNTELQLQQGYAAWELQSFLITLAGGTTVTDAVNEANYTASTFVDNTHTWKVIGDGNVKFQPQKP